MNHKAWIIHQILIYSFANTHPDKRGVGLFSQILVDRSTIGQSYLNIIQIKCHHLIRHLISSLLLSGNFDSISEVVLPVVQQEKSKYSDVFTNFVETLYD